MLYVIQVETGKESETVFLCKKYMDPECYKEMFIPRYECKKRYKGEWHVQERNLFPGYIFVETEDILDTYLSSYAVPLLTKYIGREVDLFETLTEKESGWISKLVAEGEEVPVSEIDIAEGNKVTILSGPLTELEGYVKKVDLHRRQAEVEVEFMGRKTVFYLGIEFVKKM